MTEAKVNVPVPGGLGVVIAVVAIIFFVMQVSSPSQNTDEKLREAVLTELSYKLSDYHVKIIAEMQRSGNHDKFDTLLETIKRESIKIYSIKTSTPTLHWGHNERVILRVEFSLPKDFDGGKIHTEYYRARQRTPDSNWTEIFESSVVSFYMNIL